MLYLLLLSIFFVLYVYLFYPAVLFLLTRKKITEYPEAIFHGDISIVLVVGNEEANIKKKLENLIDLEFPNGKVHIIVVDDGSTDKTADIIEQFDVTLLKQVERKGKASGLNLAMQHVETELTLFVDCRQEVSKNSLIDLSSWFAEDEKIGAVSGELLFKSPENGEINKIDGYWKYEKFIRKAEAKLSSVPGVSGALYMLRTSTFQDIPESTLLDDVQIPMVTASQGYKVIFDDRAIALDVPSTDSKKEKSRKIRTLSGNYQLLFRFPNWILPYGHPIWWEFLSHKIMRLLAPLVAIAAMVPAYILHQSGVLLGSLYLFLFPCVLFSPIIGRYVTVLNKLSIFRLLCSFVVLNWYSVLALHHYLFTSTDGAWKK